ncbi:hypothetical protein DAPPUDRAFT_98219 [Daphnia pulex]|uniref:Uncharacterized protein n=1 Tax=Daphnia pulex TaxID=6669 RepID=E9G450_DAPPU|nr:hypothetical protein DAPPUDRAFT_98219 [Daphnia pulex]|eukprot:EFX85690.1 hypothetical protein DAPPUDRAFT_98219 [Daphnia pulex]
MEKKKKKEEKEREGSLNANADRPGSHTSRDRGPRETGGGRQWPAEKREEEEKNEQTNERRGHSAISFFFIDPATVAVPSTRPTAHFNSRNPPTTADNQTPGKIKVDFQCHSVYITFPDNTPALHIHCTIKRRRSRWPLASWYSAVGDGQPSAHNTQTRRPADAFNRLFPDASNTQFLGFAHKNRRRRAQKSSLSGCLWSFFQLFCALKELELRKDNLAVAIRVTGNGLSGVGTD